MADSLRVHFDRRPGGLGKVTCRDGFLLLKDSLVADRTRPCPLCNSTAAANMAAWKILLNWMIPPRPLERHVFEAPKVNVHAESDLSEIDTTGFHVTKVPEGVVPRRNRDGNVIRKGGYVVMDTIDFRTDAAVKRRMAGGSSKWGKGRVTGSTSVCSSWAVPARPGSDAFGNSDEVLKDLRSADMHDNRARRQRKTPRKGAHQPRKSIVVRRYTV